MTQSLFRSADPKRIEIVWEWSESGYFWRCPTCGYSGGSQRAGREDLLCIHCAAVFQLIPGDVNDAGTVFGYLRLPATVDTNLGGRRCAACNSRTEPIPYSVIADLLPHVPKWKLAQDRLSISREWIFDEFAPALAFVNQVGALAEEEGHHPDILLHGWKNVRLTLRTYAAKGLTENDFILAAKINEITP